MLTFANDNQNYQRRGLALLSAQLLLFVFGLPPFHAGVWVQAEPTMVTMFVLASLNALWLAQGLHKGWLSIQRPHLLWVCLALWVGWQILATIAALSPWRSWFGPPESGVGAGWYLAALLCAVMTHALWQVPFYRRVILQVATLGLVILSLLHAFNAEETDSWRPSAWPDYLAYMAGWLFLAFMAGYEFSKFRSYVYLVAIMAAALVVANNDSARVLLPGAMLLSGVALWAELNGKSYFTQPDKLWRMLGMLACVIPMFWVVVSQQAEWFPDRRTGMGSRAEMNQVVVTTILHEPSRLLIGDGWGRFTDDALKYGMVEGAYRFRDGRSEANSYMVTSNMFDSHNQPMEALLSLGLVGMILWLAFPVLLIWSVPQAAFWRVVPIVGALTALGYVWFPLVQLMAYQGLAWAVVCSLYPATSAPYSKAKWHSPLLLVIALIMALNAHQAYNAMQYGQRFKQAIAGEPYSQYNSAMLMEDVDRGGDRLRALIVHYAMDTATTGARQNDDNARGWYMHFLQAAHAAGASPRAGARLATLELWLQNILLLNLNDPVFAPLKKESLLYFPASITHLAAIAPWREDMAAPYLLYRQEMTRGNIEEQIDLLGRLLSIHPDHRSALWIMGQGLMKVPGQENAGRQMLRHAAALGAERVWPITDEELSRFK